MDGIRILLSDLTKTIGNIGTGSNVRIKAELQPAANSWRARFALATGYDATGETPGPTPST